MKFIESGIWYRSINKGKDTNWGSHNFTSVPVPGSGPGPAGRGLGVHGAGEAQLGGGGPDRARGEQGAGGGAGGGQGDGHRLERGRGAGRGQEAAVPVQAAGPHSCRGRGLLAPHHHLPAARHTQLQRPRPRQRRPRRGRGGGESEEALLEHGGHLAARPGAAAGPRPLPRPRRDVTLGDGHHGRQGCGLSDPVLHAAAPVQLGRSILRVVVVVVVVVVVSAPRPADDHHVALPVDQGPQLLVGAGAWAEQNIVLNTHKNVMLNIECCTIYLMYPIF